MSEYGTGGENGPVFVDIYGTSRRLGIGDENKRGGPHGFGGPDPDGPFWRQGLRGSLPLWMAFWGGMFFGHGIVLAVSFGVVLISVVVGLTIDPVELGQSFNTAWIILIGIGTIGTVFAAWSCITVWRCAPNADHRHWTFVARAFVVAYLLFWSSVIHHLLG